jgi:cytochrome c biogenesis protein CcmG/thiol:disulfide interchange protein DsbE
MVLIISVVVLVAIVGLSVLLVTRQPYTATVVRSPLLGRNAPEISGAQFGGGDFSLRADRGKIVVVNFFASWCQPCQVEEPKIIDFAWQQHLNGVAVVGVVFNDTIAAAEAFDAKYGTLRTGGGVLRTSIYPSIDDPNGTFAFHYGVTSPPSTFVIDPQGRVAAELIGPVTTAQLNNVVSRIRSEE